MYLWRTVLKSALISFCRRVSDCEEQESEELEGAEEGDIVKI